MVAEKIVYAGRTMEVSRYHMGIIPKGPRRKRENKTPERIKKANLRRRTDRLRQLMNANFTDGDWSVTLTYRKGEEPMSIRKARKDAADYVARLKKCARLFGKDLKFIYVIGVGKKRMKESGAYRAHIHITANKMPDMAIVTGCWTHGHAQITPLYSDGQYKDLADYYIKNAEETKEQEIELGEKPGQMYVTSKNLAQPIVEKHILPGRFKDEPQEVKGYYLDKDSVYKGFNSQGFPLLRYTLLKEVWNGNMALPVDERKPKVVEPSKIHVQGDDSQREIKPDKKERIARGESDRRHAGSLGGLLKGIFGRKRLESLRGMCMPSRDDEHKSTPSGNMGEKRVHQLQGRKGKARRPMEGGKRFVQGKTHRTDLKGTP